MQEWLVEPAAEHEVYVFPMSFAQQRLWFLDQLAAGSPFYNIPAALRLRGRLDTAALESSLNELIRRHEVLRTTFALDDGQPVQMIAAQLRLSLPVTDLEPLPPQEQAAAVEDHARVLARQPFDLGRGPLLRVSLLRLNQAEHVLLSCLHHIIADGWSLGIFVRELTALYGAAVEKAPAGLADLEIQYADYAVWQREWLQGEVLEGQLTYWRKRLAGAPPLLGLPTDRPRPAVQSFRGATEPLALPRELSRALGALGQRQGATLFMTLLAGFAVLLSRYSGQEDIVIGAPVANRGRPEIEALIGFFVNTLALRLDLSGDPGFTELLGRVRQTALDAYAHQEMPFEQLVDSLQPERNLSFSPLFQVMFTLQNAPLEALDLPGLTVTPLEVKKETALFDLSLILGETAEGLQGVWEYNTDLFDRATVQRLSTRLRTLLEGIAAEPGRPLSRLPLLSAAERAALQVQQPLASSGYSHEIGIHQLFEEQVRRTPEAPALCGGPETETETWSYGDLNARANRLAHYLRAAGVGSGRLVAVCLERSPELVAGLLAILKAGAAYVPLDPAYPPQRLRAMLEDLPEAALLTEQGLLERLPVAARPVVCIDRDRQAIARQPADNPGAVWSGQPAYVIFTSGSTGRPKAAAVCHRSFVNLLHWFVEEFGLGPADRNLVITSLSFDLTQKTLFAPLISGGQLHLFPEEYDPRRIVPALAGKTWLNCTPSAFYPLLEEENSGEALSGLRYVFLGGEPINLARLAPWLASGRCAATLVNTYGPTECTDVCAFYRIAGPRQVGAVPIGGPIANARLLVLNRHLESVPAGVVGEVWVGGECVGLGYIDSAPLSAARFLPDPFSSTPGARLYRTGDLARYRADGAVEFIGRRDHQVKLRGYRIEPGEIEACLEQHPQVRRAAVIVREDQPGMQRLVAYLTPAPGREPDIAELREFLKGRLPGYMVPAALVMLTVLPLTPSGKLDRRALPMPDPEPAGRDWLAPRTPTEKTVAAIWREVLGRERIGLQENFFDLGGHSLLAVQVNARLRQAFQVELPLRVLFEHVTVAALAGRVVDEQLRRTEAKDLAAMLAEIDGLSEAEAERALEDPDGHITAAP